MKILIVFRQLGVNQAGASKSMERLSSGLRINRAGDDAAGLAISEKMRGQIRGLKQASRNAQDGISLIQTAEGALNETHAILQRMRELATQASNDTNVGVDRGEIQKEINQLTSEINRIGNTTEFNTMSLLDGSLEMSEATSASIIGEGVTGTVKILDAATEAFATGVDVESPVEIHGAKAAKVITDTEYTNPGNNDSGPNVEANNNELSVRVTHTDGASELIHVALEIENYGDGDNNGANDFAADVQAKINAEAGGNYKVTASINSDGKLEIATASEGAGAKVEIVGGNALTHLGAVADFTEQHGMNANQSLSIGYVTADGSLAAENITLDAGVYNDVDALVTELENKLDTLIAEADGNKIVIKHNERGSDAEITSITGAASAYLGLTNAEITEGQDVNNTIKFKVDGSTEFKATLTAGSYDLNNESTRVALAHQLETALNAVNTNDDVSVSANGTRFEITSGTTGETSSLQITEAHEALGLTSTTEVKGAEGQEEFLSFQIGANQGQSMALSINDMRSVALGISGKVAGETAHGVGEKAGGGSFTNDMDVTKGTDNEPAEYALDVSNHENATAAVEVIQQAIETVSAERSKLGATQNRLEHTISNLGTSSENLQAAESRIRDLDMAEEIMAFTKNNILQQAATAMLAQANMAPQSVLQLLG